MKDPIFKELYKLLFEENKFLTKEKIMNYFKENFSNEYKLSKRINSNLERLSHGLVFVEETRFLNGRFGYKINKTGRKHYKFQK